MSANHDEAKDAAMIELEHSPLGGSAAHRFLSCTASFLLQKQLIEAGQFENIESEYAKLGTGAHELGATAIQEDREPFEYLGEEFNGYIAGWPDGISLDAVQVYFNECKRILDTRKEQGHLLLETTIHLPHIHPLLKGTVDFGFWSLSDGVKLRDYKNGEGIGVAAPGNRQMLYYGFLLIMSDAELQKAPRDMPVELGIVQPNFYGVFEEPDVWITTLGEVMDWGHNVLIPRMFALSEFQGDILESDYVPGSHCQFCPVLLDCLVMQRAFTEFALASEDFIVMLSNEELDHYYSQREYARRFMNALEETVRARLIGGSNIPSAKLVEKRVHRVWKPGATAALQAAFGEKAYKPKEIKSPAQVEKLSSLGKDMALEWGYKPESNALSVAPLSDPRPEAKPRTNANVFTAHAASYEDQGF
jgi:Protein of unknown function (DUF2800)